MVWPTSDLTSHHLARYHITPQKSRNGTDSSRWQEVVDEQEAPRVLKRCIYLFPANTAKQDT